MIFTKGVASRMKKKNFKTIKEHYKIEGKESNSEVYIGYWKIKYARGESE